MTSPKSYSTSNNAQKNNVLYIIEEFGENLINIDGKCMDIGCGPGDVTKDILLPTISANAQIIGTDISENMIKYASETFSDEKRLQFEVLNVESKNLPKKYISEFVHIFSFNTLQWCSHIRKAFDNIYQMLRPNGTMLLCLAAFHDVFEVLRILARDIRFAQYMPDTMKNISPYHESKNPRKELKELLEKIGFTVHHCSLRESSYFEEKSQQLLPNSVLSILTFLEDMPHDLMEEFKKVYMFEYMKRKINYKSIYNDKEITLDLHKDLVVYAQKII